MIMLLMGYIIIKNMWQSYSYMVEPDCFISNTSTYDINTNVSGIDKTVNTQSAIT